MAKMLARSEADRVVLEQPAVQALLASVRGAVAVTDDGVSVENEDRLRREALDRLAWAAVFGDDADVRDTARWLIGEIGRQLGVRPASIDAFYRARGRGEIGGFTVPAINVRAMAYDTGRALFAAARRLDVGALIVEIARSEIGYTDQRPAEYVAVMTAAALREGWTGPLFVQGDHFQINAKKYTSDPGAEAKAVRNLIREAIHAGFYNIDVDTSTLVDESQPDLDAQQRLNYTLSAQFTRFIRHLEPEGVTVSIGGEIGEVGGHNSTPEELRAYMTGYLRALAEESAKEGRELPGLSKISVQTGTTHGGVVLPDGSIAQVKIDFDTLAVLSRIAREEYGLAGAVQHGASTLPDEAFDKFPQVETAEIHLATGFQNLLFEHPALPTELRARMYDYCLATFGDERKPGETDEQFLYKVRKKTLGVFKRDLWSLPEPNRAALREALEAKFAFLMERLRVAHTRELVARYVAAPDRPRPGPTALRVAAAADDWELSD